MNKATPPAPPFAFDDVTVRDRHDGWTPVKQQAFIAALAETGCVSEASRAVGMTPQSAYRLRRHFGAQSFRLAWDAALDYAIRRLSDAVMGRAINGVPVPHYYKGEQVGEHRRYDERLAMFLLRTRDRARYRDEPNPVATLANDELATVRLAHLTLWVGDENANLPLVAPPDWPTTKTQRRRGGGRGRHGGSPAAPATSAMTSPDATSPEPGPDATGPDAATPDVA